MKGVILLGLQRLVEETAGPTAWRQICLDTQCDPTMFSVVDTYCDHLTTALFEASSARLEIEPQELMNRFGLHWFKHTGPETYPAAFSLVGNDVRTVLMNVDRIHQHVTASLPGATPPGLKTTEDENGTLHVHYESARHMCGILQGLILGVIEAFGESASVRETQCVQQGSDECIFEVTFH